MREINAGDLVHGDDDRIAVVEQGFPPVAQAFGGLHVLIIYGGYELKPYRVYWEDSRTHPVKMSFGGPVRLRRGLTK
jgi:hypothetical protein